MIDIKMIVNVTIAIIVASLVKTMVIDKMVKSSWESDEL